MEQAQETMTNGLKKRFIITAKKLDLNSGSWDEVSRTVEMTKDEVVSITRAMCMINGGHLDTSKDLGKSLGSFMDPGKYKNIKVCIEQG